MIQKEVFSERLKAAMKKQNLKQIDLVRAAQVQGIKLGKSHVSQYVSGKTVPRTDILLFLAKTLQVEEEWLIGVCLRTSTSWPDSRRCPPMRGCAWPHGRGTNGKEKRIDYEY